MWAKLCLIVACIVLSVAAEPRPVVMWHGMGDTCCNPLSMGWIQDLIEKYIPGVYVYSIEVGGNVVDDELGGFIGDVNTQIEQVCQTLASNPKLKNGFNAIGFSQGGQFLRGYVERCNFPPVHNLISVGGQHQGVYGFPRCPGVNYTLCNYVRELLDLGAYVSFIQEELVQAQYWHDPLAEAEYVNDCIFLPDINNERSPKNETYKKNLSSLNKFVMVKFTEDEMVQPRESEWFGFYTAGQDKEVQTMQQTKLYQEDWIGLKTLDEAKRLDFYSVAGDHLQFTQQWFIDTIIPYFNNTQ
eukprot:TRINITY_DN3919_c0_g2_i2.p1 TRINITY_DN3919_c0_g2~~TRINITY_DN3919_c0_g2_i2.p1  ORF type:complete len:299 (-),score=47.10 TRINITY_DN3919_c0_g2_i2:3-899(-)